MNVYTIQFYFDEHICLVIYIQEKIIETQRKFHFYGVNSQRVSASHKFNYNENGMCRKSFICVVYDLVVKRKLRRSNSDFTVLITSIDTSFVRNFHLPGMFHHFSFSIRSKTV